MLFEADSKLASMVFLAGDLTQTSLLQCHDKQHRDSRVLLDLLDIFNLDCLIMKPTRKTKTTETVLDLILANDKKKVLTLVVVDRQITDHSLVYTVLRSSLPCGRSRKIWY